LYVHLSQFVHHRLDDARSAAWPAGKPQHRPAGIAHIADTARATGILHIAEVPHQRAIRHSLESVNRSTFSNCSARN
jgi:hypothetical protein